MVGRVSRPPEHPGLPSEVEAVVELPRGTLVKRRANGTVDFVSPLPCPYNYGSIPGLEGGDGDAQDALVLGPRLARGARVRLPVRAVVGFVDAGRIDDKLVLSSRPLTAVDRRAIALFFEAYALFKRALNGVRGEAGPTCSEGLRVTG